ncbi:hypothetical protein Tco_0469705, partial [Tanacetum coccineum]
VFKQGRKFAKGESSVQRDPLFDIMPEDTIDHMETENAQSEGRTREMVDEDKEIDERILSTEVVLSTDKEGVSTDFEKHNEGTEEKNEGTEEIFEGTEEQRVGTEEQRVGTEEQREDTKEKFESTDRQIKGTEDQTEEEIATQATQTSTQTPTSMIFGDNETIAKVLLNMSQAKAVSKEKEKGVELKDVEETDRPRPTSQRSLLTLKPLPKIDPKDKGKKKIDREDESKIEKENDELRLCLTIAPDEDKEVDYEVLDKKYPIIDWKTENFGTKPQFDKSKRSEEINMNVVTRSNGQKRSFSTLIRVLSDVDREDLDVVYKLVMDIYQDKIPEGVHTLMTDEGLVVHMLIEKKYPLKKEILMQMLKLKLESEEESTMALELIRFIKKVLADLESKDKKLMENERLIECWLTTTQQMVINSPCLTGIRIG